jgi:hypothetical protein
MGDIKRKYTLAIHSFIGNDTVSGICGFNNGKLLQILCDAPQDILDNLDVFISATSSTDSICKAGRKLFQYLYGAPNSSLSEIRYILYSKQTSSGILSPEKLPPTAESADEYSLRAYLQLQDWLLLETMSREPTNYGFVNDLINGYQPTTTKRDWAPKHIRDLTRCNCKTGCDNRRCSCVRNNVPCISACGHCNGVTCKNTK